MITRLAGQIITHNINNNQQIHNDTNNNPTVGTHISPSLPSSSPQSTTSSISSPNTTIASESNHNSNNNSFVPKVNFPFLVLLASGTNLAAHDSCYCIYNRSHMYLYNRKFIQIKHYNYYKCYPYHSSITIIFILISITIVSHNLISNIILLNRRPYIHYVMSCDGGVHCTGRYLFGTIIILENYLLIYLSIYVC